MILNSGKNKIALFLGGSIVNEPSYNMIGAGSSTVSVNNTELVDPTDRQLFTSTTFPSSQKITYQSDWNSVEMSGTSPLSEFGVIGSAPALTGSLWSRTVIPALTFDGTNELRIEETWEVY